MIQTTRGISAAIASSIPAAATGGLFLPIMNFSSSDLRNGIYTNGTKIADAVAPVSFMPSATFLKTGLSRCVDPAFLGLIPPTTFVPEML